MVVKDKAAIKGMRVAGRLAAEVMELIEPWVRPGVTTAAIDDVIHRIITEKQKAVPACLGYHGYPKSSCISVNAQLAHAIPDETVLKEGDLVSIDLVVRKNGYCGDTCKTFAVGKVSKEAQRLMDVAYRAMVRGIKMAVVGGKLGDVGYGVSEVLEGTGFRVSRELCGHGIGVNLHEAPFVYHYGRANTGPSIPEGTTFTVEPIIVAGNPGYRVLDDKWTLVSIEGNLAAQFEHTILTTEHGPEVLTIRQEELDKFKYL